MYLLYADDSGVSSDANVKYSVFAGFATFENQSYWIQKAADEIMVRHTGRAIFDKTKMENQYQNWSRGYQTLGNRLNERLNNFAEVPLFLDSAISRLIQVADLIAFSLFRNFEYGDDTYYSVIKDCFDKGKQHCNGLYFLERKEDPE